MPLVTTTFVPTRSTIRALSGATTIIVSANGRSRTPACNGEYPNTNCKYCVKRKMTPNIVKKRIEMVALAVVKRGLRKKFRSSIGCGGGPARRVLPLGTPEQDRRHTQCAE